MKQFFSKRKRVQMLKLSTCLLLVVTLFLNSTTNNIATINKLESISTKDILVLGQSGLESETSSDTEQNEPAPLPPNIIDDLLFEDTNILPKAEEFTVTFDTKGGTPASIEPITVTAGDSLILPSVIKLGSEFTSWTVSAIQGGAIAGAIGASYTPTRDIELWAGWWNKPIELTFDLNYIDAPTPFPTRQVTIGSSYSTALQAVGTPTRAGFIFDGWYTDPAIGQPVINTTIVTELIDHSIFAHWRASSITITFDSNYIGAPTPFPTYQANYMDSYSSVMSAMGTPNRFGYNFVGWYAEEEGINAVSSGMAITNNNDHSLYAKWIPEPVIVTYDGAGGTPSEFSKSVVYGQAYGPLATATKTGYTFAGWQTGGASVNSSSIVNIATDHTLTATWTPKALNVTFNSNGGNPAGDQTSNLAVYGERYAAAISSVTQPTRLGYTFGGWYTDEIDGIKVTVDTIVTQTADHTLWAGWIADSFVITFDHNAADASTPNPTSKLITFGNSYGSLPIVNRPGYDFSGWFTHAALGSGVVISSSTIVTDTNIQELFAHWKPQPNGVTITFDENGGDFLDFSTTTVTVGGSYGNNPEGGLPTVSRNGFYFLGWFSGELNGELVSDITVVTNNQPHTLYAHWGEKDDIVVNFETQGGTPAFIGNITVTFGQRYGDFTTPAGVLPVLTKTGYIFEGWFTELEEGEMVDAQSIVSNENNHSLYAHFTAMSGISVSFDGDGGLPIPPDRLVTFAEPYGSFPTITKPAMSFNGWHTDPVLPSRVYSSTLVTTTQDHILYAHWMATPDAIIVTFDPVDGEADPNMSDKLVTFGEGYGPLAAPTKRGYILEGWYLDQGANPIQKVTESTLVANNLSHTLYANWVAKNNIEVTFNSVGGTPDSQLETVTYGENYSTALASVTPPTKNGYLFVGWFMLAGRNNQITDSTVVLNEDNHTIYAHWTAANITIRFEEGGGTPHPMDKTLPFDSQFGTLPTVSKNGYRFDGWHTAPVGGERITPATVITSSVENQTIYAHWISNSYQVFFDENGGNQPTAFDIEVGFGNIYGGNGNLLSAVTTSRVGYEFSGWFLSPTGGSKIEDDTTVTIPNDHTLYAQWSPKQINISFNDNIGEGSSIQTAVATFDGNYAPAFSSITPPTRLGYSFAGWFNLAKRPIEITGDTKVTIPNDHTLFAYWEANEITIIYHTNGAGAVEDKTVYFADTYAPLPILHKAGYSFGGWFADDITFGIVITDATTVTDSSSPQNLYAKWIPIPDDVLVFFDANGGDILSPAYKTVTVEGNYGAGSPLPLPTRIGYDFVNWSSLRTGGAIIDDATTVTRGDNHWIYSQWQVKSNINVFFDVNGGDNLIPPQNFVVTFDKPYSDFGQFPIPTRKGYHFDGWFTPSNSSHQLVEDTTLVKLGADHSLHAHWSPNMIFVSFDENGSQATAPIPKTIAVYYNSQYGPMPTALTRPGFLFAGWYTKSIGGTNITSDNIVSLADSHTLFAHWVPNPGGIHLIFNSNGGNTPSVDYKPLTIGGEYGALAIVQRYGYNFVGWFTAPTGGKLITDTTLVTNQQEHTLFAQWSAKSGIAVTFNQNGGNAPSFGGISATFDSPYGTLPTVENAGYTFVGWYSDQNHGRLTTATTLVKDEGDHALYARWQAVGGGGNPSPDSPSPDRPQRPPGGSTQGGISQGGTEQPNPQPLLPSQDSSAPSATSSSPPSSFPTKQPTISSSATEISSPTNINDDDEEIVYINETEIPEGQDADCWVHFAMIGGILLTLAYGLLRLKQRSMNTQHPNNKEKKEEK